MSSDERETSPGSMLDTVEPVNDEIDVEEEPEPEWQKAEHEVGQEDLQAADVEHPLNVQSGDTGSIKQKIEEEAVLDYLSDKIYGGPKSTFREYMANAETAIIRAAEYELKQAGWTEDDLTVENEEGREFKLPPRQILQLARQEVGYEPTIEIEWYRDEDLMVIQDNGIGFSPREVTDVLAYTGRSGVRDRGDVSGKFGMGVLSAHKAVGKEGSYTLITRTRRDDVPDWAKDGFAAYCYLGGYDPIEGTLPDGQFGTRFELPLKRDEKSDEEYPFEAQHSSHRFDGPVIRKWISELAEWMRVQVLYHEFEDGETVHDDEYGEKEFAEDYDGAILEYEHESFTAVCYPRASNETLLLSMPIDRNHRYTPGDAPWDVDIRFRDENGVVVDGPNRGLVPVDEAEYDSMDEERRDQYIKKSELESDDITLPEPDASRDALQSDQEFWNWIGDEFRDLYQDKLADVVENVKDDTDAVLDLAGEDEQRFSFLLVGLSDYRGYRARNPSDFADSVESALEIELEDDVAELIFEMLGDVELAPRGKHGVSKKRARRDKKIWKIVRDASPDGDVYMGCTINEDRCEVAWETHDQNHVVRVENTSDYDEYGDLFDWKLLKNVPTSESSDDSDSFTIPSSLKNGSGGSAKNNSGKDPASRQLTVRFDNGQRNSENYQAKKIKSTLESAHDDSSSCDGINIGYSYYADELVLFPSNADRNISSNYELARKDMSRAAAKCTVSAYEYLKDVPGVMHVDDLITDSKDVQITTNEGDMTVEEAGNRLCVHVINDQERIERFRDEDVMDALADYLSSKIVPSDFGYSYDSEKHPDEMIYAPVDKEAWKRLQPGNLDMQYIVIGGSTRPSGGRFTFSFASDAQLYAKGRLYNWDGDVPELKSLTDISNSASSEETFAIVDTLAMLHDNGIDPASQTDNDIEQIDLGADDTDTAVATDGGEK